MNKEKKTGVIYILTNPSFPDYVKIGYAHNIETRLKQLNRSEAIPFAVRVYAMSAEDAYDLLECIAKISGTLNRLQRLTPEGHEILDEQIANEVRETARLGAKAERVYASCAGNLVVYLSGGAAYGFTESFGSLKKIRRRITAYENIPDESHTKKHKAHSLETLPRSGRHYVFAIGAHFGRNNRSRAVWRL